MKGGAPDPAVVERAVRFIRDRIEVHRRKVAYEVGEHLFKNVFGGDIAFYRSNAADGDDTSLERIGSDPRVDLSAARLRSCIQYYLLVRRHGERAPGLRVPELSVWTWHQMWALEGDPEKLVVVAAWAERNAVSQDLLSLVVRLVGPFAEAGGSLSDLLAGDPGDPEIDSPLDRVRRMAGVARGWISAGPPISSAGRRRALGLLDEIESLIRRTPAAGSAGSRPPRRTMHRNRP